MRLDPKNLNPKANPAEAKPAPKEEKAEEKTAEGFGEPANTLVKTLIFNRISEKREQFMWWVQDMTERLRRDFIAGDSIVCLQLAISMIHKISPELTLSYPHVVEAASLFIRENVDIIDASKSTADNELNKHFRLGPLMLDEDVQKVLLEEVQKYLRRHAAKDWGRVTDKIADYNLRVIESGEGMIVSRYEVPDHPDLIIFTDFTGGKSSTGIRFVTNLGPLVDLLFGGLK